jgi:hypothetical protein
VDQVSVHNVSLRESEVEPQVESDLAAILDFLRQPGGLLHEHGPYASMVAGEYIPGAFQTASNAEMHLEASQDYLETWGKGLHGEVHPLCHFVVGPVGAGKTTLIDRMIGYFRIELDHMLDSLVKVMVKRGKLPEPFRLDLKTLLKIAVGHQPLLPLRVNGRIDDLTFPVSQLVPRELYALFFNQCRLMRAELFQEAISRHLNIVVHDTLHSLDSVNLALFQGITYTRVATAMEITKEISTRRTLSRWIEGRNTYSLGSRFIPTWIIETEFSETGHYPGPISTIRAYQLQRHLNDLTIVNSNGSRPTILLKSRSQEETLDWFRKRLIADGVGSDELKNQADVLRALGLSPERDAPSELIEL